MVYTNIERKFFDTECFCYFELNGSSENPKIENPAEKNITKATKKRL